MAKAAGLTRAAVIAEAAALVDEIGIDALTLAALAQRLHVRSPSLYAHIEGLEGLRRDLSLMAVQRLGEKIRSSVLARSGRDALFAVANAYREFAREHPGLYSVTIHDPGNDEEMRQANMRAAEALTAVLESFGAKGDDVVHLYRALWGAVHGFVTLEASGVMALPVPTDESFDRLIDLFAVQLEEHGRSRAKPTRRHAAAHR